MNRKGQAFLMAAIIIAGLLFALTKISNKSVATEEPEAFYDLSEEIKDETLKVLNYGVLNGQPSALLAGQLINNYSEYISNNDVVFIYGDATAVYAVYYQTLTDLNAISLNSISIPQTVTIASSTPVTVQPVPTGGTAATVRIRNQDYTFNLKPGQNFYFVIIRAEGGEQFVTIK